MNKLIKIALATGLLVGSVATTQACSLGAWDSNTTAVAGGPGDVVEMARYSGLCAMEITAANGNVLNNGIGGATSGPAGETSMIARFYFLSKGGTGTIFTTYSDDAATTPIYTVTYSGTNVTVTSNDGGTSAVAPIVNTEPKWHSVEISWAQNGAINLWVDTDAVSTAANGTGTSGGAASVINAAVLGGTNGMIFDAYESRRTTPVGRFVVGDANGDNVPARNIFDLIATKNEIIGSTTASFSTGTADCNEDGSHPKANVFDLICVKNIILAGGL